MTFAELPIGALFAFWLNPGHVCYKATERTYRMSQADGRFMESLTPVSDPTAVVYPATP